VLSSSSYRVSLNAFLSNSWGEYWGEMGFFKIVRGKNQLGIESDCSWATPGAWSTSNFPCGEDGFNCIKAELYVDPSAQVE
jgi:cathepsin X